MYDMDFDTYHLLDDDVLEPAGIYQDTSGFLRLDDSTNAIVLNVGEVM